MYRDKRHLIIHNLNTGDFWENSKFVNFHVEEMRSLTYGQTTKQPIDIWKLCL